jgi:hypothetical protein
MAMRLCKPVDSSLRISAAGPDSCTVCGAAAETEVATPEPDPEPDAEAPAALAPEFPLLPAEPAPPPPQAVNPNTTARTAAVALNLFMYCLLVGAELRRTCSGRTWDGTSALCQSMRALAIQ